MPYAEIAQAILGSSEIRIPSPLNADTESTLVRALALASTDGLVELGLQDVGGYLDLNIKPVLDPINPDEYTEWTVLFDGVVQYIEIYQRWFIEQPSSRMSERFAGVKIVAHGLTLELIVDENVVGAFSLSLHK